MRNILLAPSPFYSAGNTPTVFAFSTEQTSFPATNALQSAFPSLKWKPTTSAGVSASITYDVGATPSISGVYVTNTNYPSLYFYATNGNTETLSGPNLIKNSHSFAGWSVTSTIIARTDSYSYGPDYLGPLASQVQFGASGFIGETFYASYGPTNSIRNMPFTGSVWAKLNPAGATASGNIQLAFKVFGVNQHTVVSTPINSSYWTKVMISGTAGAGLTDTTVSTGLYIAASNLDVLLWGAQLQIGSSTMPFTSYRTDATGLVVPTNPYTGVRQSFYDFCGLSMKKLKTVIPANTTDDGDLFSTGCILPIQSTTQVFGGHAYPVQEYLLKPHQAIDMEDGSIEYLKLGRRRLRFSIPQTWASRYSRGQLFSLLAIDPGKPILYVQNIRNPETDEAIIDPSMAYLTKLNNLDEPSTFEMPELIDRGLVLDEIV